VGVTGTSTDRNVRRPVRLYPPSRLQGRIGYDKVAQEFVANVSNLSELDSIHLAKSAVRVRSKNGVGIP